MIKLIIALGNPEQKYAFTRHNIAWQLIENISFVNSLTWQAKFKGEYTDYSIKSEKVFFLKPKTYMNKSGESVQPFMYFFKIKVDEMIVVHDDIELDFGVVGFKSGGGLGGHNGLRSIASSLGTRDFKRFRLGISRPTHDDVTSYVLGKFSQDEQTLLPLYLEKAVKLLKLCFTENFESLEHKFKKVKVLK